MLFFCPDLSGSQVFRVAVSFEVRLETLLACSSLAWEVVPWGLVLLHILEATYVLATDRDRMFHVLVRKL